MTGKKIAAEALCVGGTWDFDQKEGWTHPGSPLGELLEFACDDGPILIRQHRDYWNHHEEGLIAETLWQRVRGEPNFPAWRAGGEQLAKALFALAARDAGDRWPLLIISHSHGAQVTAYALDSLRMDPAWRAPVNSKGEPCRWQREVFWLAIDPPVRRELALVYNSAYQSLNLRAPWVHRPHLVQTRSNARNWKSWPRYLGARRWPWDASRMVGDRRVKDYDIPFVAQPGGHSDVLLRPRRHDLWWYDLLRLFSFGGGRPLMAEDDR